MGDEDATITPPEIREHPAPTNFDLDDERAADAYAAAVADARGDPAPPLNGGPTSGLTPRPERRSIPPTQQPGPRSHMDRPERPERPDRPERVERATPVCSAPQLRRFIKSRAYVPMHELRRRFAIEGGDDDVTGVLLESGRIFVGLPSQEGNLLGDLLRNGEVGFELSMDPQTPIVVGVYAMRPVPRS